MHLSLPFHHKADQIGAPAGRTHPADERIIDPSLQASIRDAVAYGAMCGAGEGFYSAAAIAAHASPFQVGLLSTLPAFVGALVQLGGLYLTETWRKRREICVMGAAVQALSFIPLALILVLRPDPALILLFTACSYAGAGFGAPAWNSLIGDLVPADLRGRFFSRRNGRAALASFAATLAAGKILDLCAKAGSAGWGFFTIFLVAGGARAVSARELMKHQSPEYSRPAPAGGVKNRSNQTFARFLFFFSSLHLAAAISGPYFALYMLRDLHLSYMEFTLVTGAAVVSQYTALRFWGPLADRIGTRRVLSLCAYAVGFVPLLWLFNESVSWLIAVQIAAGFAWAGFNLAAGNFLFDTVSPERRARGAAAQGIMQGLFVLCGSLIGAVLIKNGAPIGPFFPTNDGIRSTALSVFFISGVLRLSSAALWIPRISRAEEADPLAAAIGPIFPLEHRRPPRSWKTDLELAGALVNAAAEGPSTADGPRWR